jgi:ubiquinone/menaquinone biosynthesis C-methylase UbiE
MQAVEYYEKPGIAQDYINWCVKGNAGCPPADAIIKIIKGIDDMRDFSKATLVDLGCGPGTSMPMLIHVLKFEKCILVDASDEMLHFAKRVFGHNKGIITMKGDLREDLSDIPDESAEVVMSCSTIPYLDSIGKCIIEASRILKPGGYFGFNGFFHMENDLNSRPRCNDFGVDFYHHSYKMLHQLAKAVGLEEVGSVTIEKSKEEKVRDDFLKGFLNLGVPGMIVEKEEVLNRLMVFEKH